MDAISSHVQLTENIGRDAGTYSVSTPWFLTIACRGISAYQDINRDGISRKNMNFCAVLAETFPSRLFVRVGSGWQGDRLAMEGDEGMPRSLGHQAVSSSPSRNHLRYIDVEEGRLAILRAVEIVVVGRCNSSQHLSYLSPRPLRLPAASSPRHLETTKIAQRRSVNVSPLEAELTSC